MLNMARGGSVGVQDMEQQQQGAATTVAAASAQQVSVEVLVIQQYFVKTR